MPRKRMIDPKVWDDPDVQALAPTERLLFFGLISHADDYGHISANPAQLRKWVFGYDNFTVEQVREMRDHILASCHNVHLYHMHDQDYIWLATWERQQDLRWRAKADYPCHACGAYHKHDDWDACKTSPVNAEALRNIYAISTQDARETLRTREEKRREENIEEKRVEDKEEPELAADAAPPHPGKPPPMNLTAGQRFFLQSFNRKRFANSVQAQAVADLEKEVGTAILEKAITWAAKKGTSDVEAITTAARKMKAHPDGKESGDGRNDKPSETTGGKYAGLY